MERKLIKWDNRFQIGHKLIDDQHMKLFEMINDLYTSFIEGTVNENTHKLVDEMIKYTDYHFKVEEKFFEKYSYPEIEQHKEKHLSFVNKVVEFKQGLESEKVTVPYDIMNFLRQWLINHILKEDKKFAEFFSEKEIELKL